MGDAASGIASLARGALGLPDLLLRAEKIVLALEVATEDGGRLSPASIEAAASRESRPPNLLGIALWIIALGVSWMVLVG